MKLSITKLIGAATIAIAVLVMKYQPFAASLAFIAGLVLAVIPKKAADEQWDMLVQSIDKHVLLISLFDALFFSVTAAVSWLFGFLFAQVIEILQKISLDKELLFTAPEIAQQSLYYSKEFYASLGTTAVLYIASILILYAVSRSLIWGALTNTKVTVKLVRQFFLFTIAWFALFLIPAWLFFGGLKSNYYAGGTLLLFALYGHLTALAHYTFVRTPKVKEAIITAFSKGILDIKHFIVPYAYLLIIILVTSRVVMFLPRAFQQAGVALYFILYLGWYRHYMKQVFRRNIFKSKR